jgi:hypothetical protein
MHIDRDSHYCSKGELLLVLQRIGLPHELIAEIETKLPDSVDLDEAGALLQGYGLTRDEVISRLGGSP